MYSIETGVGNSLFKVGDTCIFSKDMIYLMTATSTSTCKHTHTFTHIHKHTSTQPQRVDRQKVDRQSVTPDWFPVACPKSVV